MLELLFRIGPPKWEETEEPRGIFLWKMMKSRRMKDRISSCKGMTNGMEV